MVTGVETNQIPDLTNPQTFAAGVPHEAFARLRETPGFHWQPTEIATANGGFWAVTRFADIVEIESNPALFASQPGGAWPSTNLSPDPAENPLYNNLMMMDPPRHSSVRRVAAAAFGPRIVKNFDPWVREIVVEVLERIEHLDEFDYILEVAQIIPSFVIARVQGVPAEDRQWIVDQTLASFEAMQTADVNAVGEVLHKTHVYYREKLVPEKLRNPQSDMTSVLIHAAERGEITEAEAYDFLNLLQAAGFETTHTLIGQSMRMILESPEIADKTFRGIEELGPDKVIEEFLRFITPAMFMSRTATQDTVVGDQQVRENDLLNLYFTAANRDPAVFANPDEFDPWRTETASLAFGSGPHRCIGNALAKLELRILFEEMAKRDFRFRLNGAPQRGWSTFINQIRSLPVARVS
ncbi:MULTISPECIES: cytochrome P450 [Streptomyces]|uniref:cytochrome P450 n=1 Tax=Streptomyces TaxID=1883 RepID=UPI000B15CFC5|nr:MULTISPECIES: cytochrome P450 [Streptomyces]MDI5906483.1 cytochrome P450 [Streptomyces sp. 12257]